MTFLSETLALRMCGRRSLGTLRTGFYYVLFFLHLEKRRVTLAGITQHPTEMVQMARGPWIRSTALCAQSVSFRMIATRSSAVHCPYAGAGHYGRSNSGNAGAEDKAVMILSQAVGKPVRVHWMRNDDPQWSTVLMRLLRGRARRRS